MISGGNFLQSRAGEVPAAVNWNLDRESCIDGPKPFADTKPKQRKRAKTASVKKRWQWYYYLYRILTDFHFSHTN